MIRAIIHDTFDDIHFHGYQHVQSSGLPHHSGKYFLITVDDQLLFADLQLTGSVRTWQCYTAGGPIDESLIRRWKKMPGQ